MKALRNCTSPAPSFENPTEKFFSKCPFSQLRSMWKTKEEHAMIDTRARVVLVQPLGVREMIFPWGIQSIGDYLEGTMSNVDVNQWLLQREEILPTLLKEYRIQAEALLALLNKVSQRPFLGHASMGEAAFDLSAYIAWLGASAVERLNENNCYVPHGYQQARAFADDFDALKQRFLAYIDKRIDQLCEGVEEGKLIWGLSVYDRTLFFCLSFARHIRNRLPTAKIIFGGDYFIFTNANKLMRHCGLINGIVVGYGEETMRQIVEAIAGRRDVSKLEIQSFINAAAIARAEPIPGVFADKGSLKVLRNAQERLQVINVPPTYRPRNSSPIHYVHEDASVKTKKLRVLRVLFQRGCSYGKCTFCTQIDKTLYFRLNHSEILEAMAHRIWAIREESPRDCIKVSFDADEHAPKALFDILDFFASDAIPDDIQMFVSFWIQVKYVNERVAKAIAAFKKPNVHLNFVMNFETLNTNSLALMSKGHSPLRAIFGAKVIKDSSHHLTTNYMEFFPGENEDNVAGEVRFLQQSMHLVAGRIFLFPYAINGRDDLYQNQKKYGIRVRPLPRDIWIRDVFDLDLETSFWNYFFEPIACSAVTRAWYEFVIDKSESTAARFEEVARSEKSASYQQRAQVFAWLRSVGQLPMFARSPVSMEIEDRSTSSAKIEKDYMAAPSKVRESKYLSADELRFLRFLYQPRQWTQVENEFRDSIGEGRLKRMRDAHLDFGSLARDDDWYLCTASDPKYWDAKLM
jgi:hypothetical protein